MKPLRYVLLMFIVVFALGLSAQPQTVMEQGNAAYQRGDYPTAASLYEQLLLEGVQHDVVYYNLGTTYYQMRQLGEAMLSYRRAQRLNPRDPALNISLARLRAERVDFQGDHVMLVDQLASLTQSSLTLVELGTIVLALWSAWFGLALGWLFVRRWRLSLLVALAVTGILLLIGLGLFVPRAYGDAQRPEAVVTALSAPVRSGPDDGYLDLFELFAGAEIRVLETHNGWARFILPDGRQGWIQGDYIALV
ncbi:MAG: tetratricopeptide repeat protein [Anaerolineae bacterium]